MAERSEARKKVIKVLRRHTVLPMDELMDLCDCSRATVLNALKPAGYLSSYNYNARFYVLADVPKFDEHGLWEYEGKRFSRCGTLTKTIIELVETSEAGYVPAEVEAMVGVRCRHVMRQLAAQGRLARQAEGPRFVYFAAESERCAKQKAQRAKRQGVPERGTGPLLPPGVDTVSTIRTLVVAIERPKAKARTVAADLRKEGLDMTAQRVRDVLAYYDLSKKKGS